MAFKEKGNTEIVFDIEKHIGVLSKGSNGWQKEVNVVAWNNNPAKIDIRDWDFDHKHMSRGITLNQDETLNLIELLNGAKVLEN